MALIKNLDRITMERNVVHDDVEASYCVFQDDRGRKYLQINTYGSRHRKMPGKTSQSIQLGPEALQQLQEIIETI